MKALILLITSTLVIMADFTIAPVLPRIKEAFADTPNIDLLVKMVLTTPALFIVVSSPFIGYLADKYGRKNIVLAGVLFYVASGAAGYLATSVYELLAGRAIFGIAISAVITGCSALITDNYKGTELSRMMGLQSAFIGFGGILYMIVGGFIADFYWRNTFLIYLSPLILLVLFAIFIDEPGTKRKTRTPLVSFDLRKYAKIYLAAFVLMSFFYMIPLQIPFYLKSVVPGINNSVIGLTLAIVSFFSAITSIFYKSIKNRLSFSSLFILPFIIMGAGYIIIYYRPDYLFSVMGLIVTGLGMGLVIPNLRVWVGSISDMTNAGRAFGGLTTCFYLGQVFSPLLINTVNGNFSIAGVLMVVMSSVFLIGRSDKLNR